MFLIQDPETARRYSVSRAVFTHCSMDWSPFKDVEAAKIGAISLGLEKPLEIYDGDNYKVVATVPAKEVVVVVEPAPIAVEVEVVKNEYYLVDESSGAVVGTDYDDSTKYTLTFCGSDFCKFSSIEEALKMARREQFLDRLAAKKFVIRDVRTWTNILKVLS